MLYLLRCRCYVRPRQPGSPWQALDAGERALLVLVYLRTGEPFAEPGRVRVMITTRWRYVNATVETARRAGTDAARGTAGSQTRGYVVIDDTLIPIDRVAADRPLLLRQHKGTAEPCK